MPSKRRTWLRAAVGWCGIIAGTALIVSGCAGGGRTTPIGKSAPDTPPTNTREAEARRSVTDPVQDDRHAFGVTASRRLSTLPSYVPRPPEMFAGSDTEDMESLPLVAVDTTIVVTGHKVRVVLDLVFWNNTDSAADGTLMVQLPNGASPSGFGMYLGSGVPSSEWGPSDAAAASELLPDDPPAPDRIMATRVRLPDPVEGKRFAVDWGTYRPGVILETSDDATEDPGPASWQDVGRYAASVSPFPPDSLKRIMFAYDQTLAPEDGKIALRLPVAEQAAPWRRVTIHEIGASFTQSEVRFGEREIASQRSAYGRVWNVPLQDKQAEPAVFTASQRNPAALYLSGADSAITGTLTTILVQPALPSRSMVTSTGRALFVLDTSYSGRNGAFAQSGRLLREVLESDDSLTEFAVLCFDVRTTLLTPGFVKNTRDARENYLARIERIRLEGGTDIGTMLAAVGGDEQIADADAVFLLSDGNISWGNQSVSRLAAAFPNAMESRWICYSMGDSWNQKLFETLTSPGGRIVRVVPGQDLTLAARAHRFPKARLDGVFSTMQDAVIVADDPAYIYPGQILEIAVRTTRTTGEIRLVIRIDGAESEVRIPLTRSIVTDPIAARAWAEIFTNDLLSGNTEAAVQAGLAMSRRFRLTNDHAMMVVLADAVQHRRFVADEPEFDFRQVWLTIAETRRAARTNPRLYAGMEMPAGFSLETAALVKGLAALQDMRVWRIPPLHEVSVTPRTLVEPPIAERTTDSALDIIAHAAQVRSGEPADTAGTEAAVDAGEVPAPESDEPASAGATGTATGAEAAAAPIRKTPGKAGSDPKEADVSQRKADPELDAAHAMRILSTIAELAPDDPHALRLTAFVLMEWGAYRDARSVFSRIRSARPFEPQNLIMEAVALTALGQAGNAALRYELVLQTEYPRFEEFSRPVAEMLYADLLRSVIREFPDHQFRNSFEQRLTALQQTSFYDLEPFAGQLVLFWNRDDTDLDLYVKEGWFTHVSYQHRVSRTGGRLYWDNTEGLGPELYRHPRMSVFPYRVSVDYFASSLPKGALPVSVLVSSFRHNKNENLMMVDWYTDVLHGTEPGGITIIKKWGRAR